MAEKFQELGKGIVKRKERRVIGLFIDGTGLDRATRRLNRRVEMSKLVAGVSSGLTPVVARYYTLIPYEDDSRQRAFLDAVLRAGLDVVVKRLPPKGVNRQVSVDVEMAADIVAFALGHQRFSDLARYQSEPNGSENSKPTQNFTAASQGKIAPLPGRKTNFQEVSKIEKEPTPSEETPTDAPKEPTESLPPLRPNQKEKRIVTVVCPSRDLAYPVSLVNELGVDTVNADFGQFNAGDILKSAAKWIDLTDSETIWRES